MHTVWFYLFIVQARQKLMKGIRSWIVVTYGKEARGNNWERQKEVLSFGLSGGYMGEFSM